MSRTVVKLTNARKSRAKNDTFYKLLEFLMKLILFWLPKANQDFEHLFDLVDYWHIEVENGTGQATREVGFDFLNKPIVFAPTNRNYGMWTDSERVFAVADFQKVDDIEFDKLWNYLRESRDVNF